MPALDIFLQEKLAALAARQQRRALVETVPLGPVTVERNGQTLISFAGNDYLGLAQHPEVRQAAIEAAERYGAGAGASRLITGTHPLYVKTEARLAALKGTEAALIFGSGYLANLGTIPALVGKDDLILVDELAHACMFDGIRLSGAASLRFKHNSIENAAALLTKHRGKYRHVLLATETIFSMDGDCSPLVELQSLADRHDAWLVTDDAHGTFTQYGKHAHIQVGTLSKAVGAYGGYVCGSRMLVDYLVSVARSFMFTTGLPPSVVGAAHAALGMIAKHPEWPALPLARARQFTLLVGLPEAQSQIVPWIVGENDKALTLAEALRAQGFLVSAIRPPTVPVTTARLRFSFSAAHTEEQVEALAEAVKALV